MKFAHPWVLTRAVLWSLLGIVASASCALAANQTADITPIQFNSALPYKITVQPYDFGAAELPTLHSYNAAEVGGKWIVFAGRTNGLHSFDTIAVNNFPPQFQNQDVWVIDPVAKQSWHRSLTEASANIPTAGELRSLTPGNTQFYQKGDRLYVTGGYGLIAGTNINGTHNTLSSIDLPGMMDWVVNGTAMGANTIRQINGSQFTVTGGAMYEINGRTHLVFGQNFQGNYTPGSNGAYTSQVRSFDILDDGTTLSVANVSSTPADATKYRRRDLNIVPVIRPDTGSGLGQGLAVLSGVFTTTDGIWTVPVDISDTGVPSMDDPNDPATFKQGFNGYHAAKVGLFSEASGSMHEVLFGGISLQSLDTATQSVITDPAMPFVNDITSVVIDSAGNYSQHWLGQYPVINDLNSMRLRFGANAEFFPAEGLQTYGNGVLKLDALTQPTLLGYIFGGIASNSPNTRDPSTGAPIPGAASAASNRIFAVMYTPVPEPVSCGLALFGLMGLAATRRRRRAQFVT